MPPASVDLADVTIESRTEGRRTLPLTVTSENGAFISSNVSVAFSAEPGEEIVIELARVGTPPDVTLSIRAEWEDRPAAPATELEQFLTSVPGLAYEEIATGYAGYRAYLLVYEQPLDHRAMDSETFLQRAVLHHRDRAAPMVLYTTGYALFEQDYVSELGEAMQANQLSTEQRFFGTSTPADLQPEDWEHVTIEQAAADHHRLVEALKPFYEGSWVSTGHSKGGMTSIYHRRFHPNDVDATVAYVAPISFAPADPRYVPFLDQIGTDDCRETLRDLQAAFVERLDELLPLYQAAVDEYGLTYERAGGLRFALEDGIEGMEWSFWQGEGITACANLPTADEVRGMSTDDTFAAATARIGYGGYDAELSTDFAAYNYQAARELGYQSFSTEHLVGLQSPGFGWQVPEGTAPEHTSNAMEDMQFWVNDRASHVIFLYGEFDPWSGGAFALDDSEDVVRVTAPQANHGAAIRDLEDGDRERVLDLLETWMGTRPDVGGTFTPSRAVHPARLLNGTRPDDL